MNNLDRLKRYIYHIFMAMLVLVTQHQNTPPAMDFSELPQDDEFNTYSYEYVDRHSSFSSSNQSTVTSPLDETPLNISSLFPSLCWETPCLEQKTTSFEEAAAALKQHKDITRKAQNRSAQRAYRERQQTRLRELQATISDLTTDRDKLRVQVKVLESDLSRMKMDATISRIKCKRRDSVPVPARLKRRPTLEREDSVGWMLKHMYGLEEAAEGMFAVFEVEGIESM